MKNEQREKLERGIKLALLKELLNQDMISSLVFDQVVRQWGS